MTPWTCHWQLLGFGYWTHDDGGALFEFRAGRFRWSCGMDPDFSRRDSARHAD